MQNNHIAARALDDSCHLNKPVLRRPTAWPENLRAEFFIEILKKPEYDPNMARMTRVKFGPRAGRVRANLKKA